MDIRLWLKPKRAAEAKKRKIEDDDDDDVIPESPDVQIKSKKKKINGEKKSNDKKVVKPALKAVTVSSNLFGGPIKRTEPIVKKDKKKTETGIHSDDEFEKSLLEIDSLDAFESNHEGNDKKTKSNKKSETEVNNHNNKSHNMEGEKEPQKTKDKSHKLVIEKSVKLVIEKSVKLVIEKSPSTSNEFKKSTLSTKKKIDDIKKEIKEPGKRKFAEFIDDHDGNKTKDIKTDANVSKTDDHDFTADDSVLEEHNDSKIKKRKVNKSMNESMLTDEERHERRMQSAALYQKYLNRSGPKHLGTKEMPEGAPNCLKDCAFLLTGVLDSFEREEIVETINKYGGCIKSGVTKKVTHVLAGQDAGPAKMAKAQELGIKIINEDDFLKLIKDSNKPSTTKDDKDIKKEKKAKHSSHKSEARERSHTKSRSPKKEVEKNFKNIDETKDKIKKEKNVKSDNNIFKSGIECKSSVADEVQPKSSVKSETDKVTPDVNAPVNGIMWVEKYKPQNVKQIIGQLGDNSNVKKLTNWLTKWYVNRKVKQPKPSPWSKTDDGGFYKAALLSGPPGVGKTTTVSLVCKELGFDVVEFNASDTRNKTLIREQIGELLTTNSLSGYAKGETGKQAVSKKHVLVMDEVDGMAGNEDRGGLQELIGLIKSASVPIICMCNDRNSQKMRSLVNYCYDLRFSRPRVDQIKAAMRSICCKENIKIPPDTLGQLIVSAGQDVRQTLNLLSMWAVEPSLLDADRLNKDARQTKKDVKLGPWDAIRKVFSSEDHKTMTIADRSELFFYDYSLAPLFVQENYLQVVPHCPKHETLDRISKAADSIAFGDLIDKRIRSSQAWSLLPMQAMYSSVLPGHYLSGHVGGQIQFPGWLGKNSRATKMHRLCQEIHAHTRLSTTGSKSSIFLDYSSHLRDAIITPLIKDKADGIEQALAVLQSYHLLREDLDSLTELSLWPGQRNPTVLIDSKVKAAMTRTYNKKATALPYAPPSVKRARPKTDQEDDIEEEEADEEPDSDPEHDALIKKKKTKETEKSSSDKPSTSEVKSNSKGKGKSKKK